jgi:predicted nucleic acid-binding protein
VVYDACVLYPASIRDLLLQLATTKLVRAKWTERIHQEWIENLLVNRPELSRELLERTRERMNTLPDCLISGYEQLEAGLELPDADDRHVLAAAIHGGAQAIVTYNLVDFPDSELNKHNVIAIHPDEFVLDLVDLDSQAVLASVRRILQRLKNPPIAMTQYIEVLRKNRLSQFASYLGSFDNNDYLGWTERSLEQ